VFNDRGYGVLRTIEARTFDGRMFGVELNTPDFVAVGKAMGVPGEAAASAAEFEQAFRRGVEADGPYLLDIDMTRLAPMGGLGSPPPRR
jgi:acetolactate synthase-1/2/3 large subunit